MTDVRKLLEDAENAPNPWDKSRGKTAENYAGRCAICGESCYFGDDIGEMHDPENPEEAGGIVHAQCGIDKGWVVS